MRPRLEPAGRVRPDRDRLQPRRCRGRDVGRHRRQIFNGEITNWNDDAIAEENEGVELPDQDISVVYRSDESGTTDNFQKYLEAAAPDAWKDGAGKTFNGGTGEGARGNEGVSAAVAQTPGTITYTERSYAKSQDLGMVTSSPRPTPRASSSTPRPPVRPSTRPSSSTRTRTTWSSTPVRSTSPRPRARTRSSCRPTRSCAALHRPEMALAVKSFLSVAVAEEVQEQLEAEGYIPSRTSSAASSPTRSTTSPDLIDSGPGPPRGGPATECCTPERPLFPERLKVS